MLGERLAAGDAQVRRRLELRPRREGNAHRARRCSTRCERHWPAAALARGRRRSAARSRDCSHLDSAQGAEPARLAAGAGRSTEALAATARGTATWLAERPRDQPRATCRIHRRSARATTRRAACDEVSQRTPMPGVLVAIVRQPRRRARQLRAPVLRRRARRRTGRARDRADQPVAHARAAAAVRGLHFQRAAARRDEARALPARRACSTSPSTCARARRRSCAGIAVELSPANGRMLVVPEGCAHGFQALAPDSELLYLHTAAYAPDAEGGVACERSAPRRSRWPLPVPTRRHVARAIAASARSAAGLRRDSPHELPSLRRGAAPRVPRPGLRAAVERVPRAPDARRRRKPLSAAPVRLRPLLAGADARTSRTPASLFGDDYAYFSSTRRPGSSTPSATSQTVTRALRARPGSLVVEVASNDGYLLQNFVAGRAFRASASSRPRAPPPPRESRASRSSTRVLRRSDSRDAARGDGRDAPTWSSATTCSHTCRTSTTSSPGFTRMLKPGGTVTLEFPHLMRLIEHAQFDTVYHEHFSYLSLHTVQRIFARAGSARLRRRGAADARRQPARVRRQPDDARATQPPRSAAMLADEVRRGHRSHRRLSRLPGAGRARQERPRSCS